MIRNFHIWGPGIVSGKLRRLFEDNSEYGVKHVIFAICDHFEPRWKNPGFNVEKERIKRWTEMYPKSVSGHKDSNGNPPQHTWFYAAEEYRASHLEELINLCKRGLGEIELHLHHADDTPEGLKGKLEQAKIEFSRHGALITKGNPRQQAFGFIHGNWALNNSRKGSNYCGVNNELRILRDAGCYADFTLPSAPAESQTRKVNSIYYAIDIPGTRKSHDQGVGVIVGGKGGGDLMLIQGPLALSWKRRKFGIFPRIENGCIQRSSPGTPERIDLWVKQHIHVKGRPEWIFAKVYCHGAQEEDIDTLLGESAHRMYSHLETKYNDGNRYLLHYVTAREMYNIVKAAEAGEDGNPTQYKDYMIKPYLNSGKRDGST